MTSMFKNMMPGGGDANGAANGASGDSGDNDVPWWLKYAGKAAAIAAGIGK
jgi:hypothetical protein